MAESFFPPVVVTFVASTAEAVVQVDRMAASFEATGAAVKASMTEVSAAAGTAGEAVTAADAAINAANERALASFATLSAQAERSAEQVYVSMAGMAAKTQASLAELEAAEARAAGATAAFAASVDASAVKGEMAAARYAAIQKGALLVGAAGLVASGMFVHMAGDFESATQRLVSSAGETQANLGMVRDGILALGPQVGNTSAELAKAMYIIESGGQHAADGLKVLKAAAQGAKTEGAELVPVADAITSILQDYHLKADSAALVTSKLVAAVGAGKTTFQEFTSSLSSILPIASSAKISLDDILGALASMTVHGMSAAQASQNMADAVKHMLAPTQVQAKELGQLGMSAQDLAGMLSEKGLTGTLNVLTETILKHMGPSGKVMLDTFNQSKDAAGAVKTMLAGMPPELRKLADQFVAGSITVKDWNREIKALPTDQAQLATQFASLENRARGFSDVLKSGQPAAQSYQDALRRVMGDATGLNVALMLTGENTEYVTNAVKTVTDATNEADGSVKGWHEIQGTFNQRLSEAKAGAEALGVSIGQKLLPVASRIMEIFAAGAQWISQHKAASTALAIVLGGMLVIGLAAATAAVWSFTVAMLANPMTWIVLGIMALIVAIILLATHWKQVWHAISEAAGTAWDWLKVHVFQPIGDFFDLLYKVYIKPWVDLWNWAWKLVAEATQAVANWLNEHVFKYLGAAIDNLKDWIGGFLDFWKGVWHGAGDAIKWVYDNVIKPTVDLIREAVAFAKDPLGHVTGTDVATGMTGGLKLPHHQDGGWVAGPLGAPRLIVAHGGEYVLSEAMLAGRRAPDLGSATAMTGATGQRGGGNTAGTVVVVNVAGSVWSERDLQNQIQKTTLRYNQRNSSNGLTFGAA